jgi:hypothetical protein
MKFIRIDTLEEYDKICDRFRTAAPMITPEGSLFFREGMGGIIDTGYYLSYNLAVESFRQYQEAILADEEELSI